MSNTIIKIEELSKKIDNKYLLKDVNLEIKSGEFVVLLGPNGAGKSTLIKCLTGLYKIDEGKITVGGLEWNRKNDQKIKSMISYIPDKANFDYNLTIEQNLVHHAAFYGISASEARKKSDELLEFFNILERKDDYINKLSYGMQKKALIIRGLLSSPNILIFDEPTLGLDPKAKQDLMLEIQKLNSTGITVLLSTQSLQVANQSDRVVFIEEGYVKDMKNAKQTLDLSKEKLGVSTAAMDEHSIGIVNETLSKNESVYNFTVTPNSIEVQLESSNQNILKCLSDLLETGINIYTIEFRNASYMSLFEEN